MIEWTMTNLKEVTIKIGSGSTPTGGGESYKKSGVSLVRSQNVLDFTFSESGLAFIDEKQAHELRSVTLEEEDVLLNITGDSVARCCMLPSRILPGRVNQHVAIIRANREKSVPKYLLYNILYQKETLLSFSEVGATRRALTKSMIEKFELLLPSIPEQEAIAEVLSSLDDKIYLLQRNNSTLEQLIAALFFKYFQDVSWNSCTIDEVAIVQNGCSFKSSEFIDIPTGTYEVFKMGHISANGGLRSAPKKDFVLKSERIKRWVLNKRDIVLAMTDMKDNVVILGVPALIDRSDHYALNQRVARIYLKENSAIINPLLLYFQMRDKNFIATLQSKANSGVQVNLTTESIKNCEILVPPIDMQKEILLYLGAAQDKLEINRIQMQQLESLRNTLLPKLMSGAVRVTK